MPHRLKFFQPLFQNWGFSSGKDYLLTVLGLKAMDYVTLAVQVVGAVLTGGFVFMAQWIWEPPGAAMLIVSMNLLNARYGYLVAKKIKGEKFSRAKFHRTFAIVVSDVLLLAMIHHAIKFYPYYSPLGHVLFGWLFMHRAGAIIKHMADLKLQDGGLKRYMITWFLRKMHSDIASKMVDNIQGRKEVDKPTEEDIL